jgi:hypothetical protein
MTYLGCLQPPKKQNSQMHVMSPVRSLERYFSRFRQNIIGQEQFFETPYGPQRIIYADWTASGRAYRPIEMRAPGGDTAIFRQHAFEIDYYRGKDVQRL